MEIPCVLSTICTVGMPGASLASVSVDDFKESYKMTEYLIGLGHKKIAFITAPKNDASIGKLRLMGYREELVCYMDEKRDTYSYQSGYRLMQELLKRETFTAVYATADTLAIGACRALKEAGISVPEECSVAGFDGMDAGRFYIPSLTTIRQPVEEIGKATAGLLFDLIKGKEKPRQLIYEGELIQRESTARCKQ